MGYGREVMVYENNKKRKFIGRFDGFRIMDDSSSYTTKGFLTKTICKIGLIISTSNLFPIVLGIHFIFTAREELEWLR